MQWSNMASSTGCVFSVMRLVDQFHDTNAQKFKQVLMKELECTNETQFLCKLLPTLSQLLTNESLTRLKNEAIKLAEQQASKINNNISVYKEMQQKYTDRLSNLHSDIIDYFGTFLDKQQSIELGYLNKQLYIETQKISYLSKRNNDLEFSIDDFVVDRFFWKGTNPFAYSLPKSINISVNSMQILNYPASQLQSSKWYKSIFNVLNSLTCSNFSYLASIPIEIFFNQNIHSKHGQYSGRLPQISKFQCLLEHNTNTYNHCPFNQEMKNSVTKFCDNFNKYFNHHCQNKFTNIRNIKQLVIGQHTREIYWDENTRKQVLLSLGPVSEKIKISHYRLDIDNKNEVSKIFHPNLKVFEIDNMSFVNFGDAIKSIDVNCNHLYGEFELSIIVDDEYCYTSSIVQFISKMRKVGLQKNVVQIRVSVDSPIQNMFSLLLCSLFNVDAKQRDSGDNENGMYTQKSINNHNNVSWKSNEIILTIENCDTGLSLLEKCFLFLNENESQILDWTRNNINTVIFVLCFDNLSDGIVSSYMFSQTFDTEYPIDKTKIVGKDCDLSLNQLDVLYQNIIKWLQSIQFANENQTLDGEYHFHLKIKQV